MGDIINTERQKSKTAKGNLAALTRLQSRRNSLNTPKKPKSSDETSSSTLKKRSATSPLEKNGENQSEKQKKELQKEGEWIDVNSKRKPKKKKEVLPSRNKKLRSEAVIIKPKDGKTYAQVLGQIRKNVKPEDTDTVIKHIHETRNGCVGVEISRVSKDKKAFAEALTKVVGELGTVESRTPKASLEIRDLDCITTKEEVEEEIKNALNDQTVNVKVFLTKRNARAEVMAIVETSEEIAENLPNLSRIKIG